MPSMDYFLEEELFKLGFTKFDVYFKEEVED